MTSSNAAEECWLDEVGLTAGYTRFSLINFNQRFTMYIQLALLYCMLSISPILHSFMHVDWSLSLGHSDGPGASPLRAQMDPDVILEGRVQID